MSEAVHLSLTQSAHDPGSLTLSLTAGLVTIRKELKTDQAWRVADTIGAWYGWILLNISDKRVATDEEVATDLTKGQHHG